MKYLKLTKENFGKYKDSIIKLADEGLSRGYLTNEEMDLLINEDHFCHFILDDSSDEKLISFNYGRVVSKENAAEELRCSIAELEELFPGKDKFIIDDGCVCKPELRGKGISRSLFKWGRNDIFSKADVILFFVWNRHGGERRAVRFIDYFGGLYYKTVPAYWKDYPGLVCSICGVPCTCACDMYYLTKENFLNEDKD